MQEISKPKGFAKIWREIKRPFRKLWREIKRPFKQLGRCFKRFVREMAGFDELRSEYIGLHSKYSGLYNGLNKGLYNDLYNDLSYFIQRSITTSILHQKTFSRFKSIHQSQEIVLVACGPSAKDYQRIDHAIHIGVNRAFQLENIDLHYLFMADYFAVKPYIKEANRYKPESCAKFYALIDWLPGIMIPESEAIEANALRFRTDCTLDRNCNYGSLRKSQFRCSIDVEPLGGFQSIIFPAMQFALWTNPRTIYLVGCDCTEGYFDGQASQYSSSHLVPFWNELKEFVKQYYPETAIKCINPVGLRGVFDER